MIRISVDLVSKWGIFACPQDLKVSADVCSMRILHHLLSADTHTWEKLYPCPVCGYRMYPCVTREGEEVEAEGRKKAAAAGQEQQQAQQSATTAF